MIIHGDALEVLRKLEPGKVKCIFADVPDNLGLKYNLYDDKMKNEHYYNWIKLLIMESLPKCELFWLSYYPKHDLEIKSLVRDILKYRHPSFNAMMFIWRFTFSQYQDSDCAYGYRPLLRLMRTGSTIYSDKIREVSKRQLLGDARAGGLRADPERVPDNVWSFPRVVGNSPERCPWHPTQHPIKLMKRLIQFSVDNDEVFMDMFGGTGSTLRAAIELKYPWTVIVEMDKEYCSKVQEATKIPVVEFDPVISNLMRLTMINNQRLFDGTKINTLKMEE